MRRYLGTLSRHSKHLIRQSEGRLSITHPGVLGQSGSVHTANAFGTQSLLSSLLPRCTASVNAAKNFPQKNKSQRGVSSQGKASSSTDDLLGSVEKDGEGFQEADVVSVWRQLADGAESMSPEDRESKIHKSKGFQTLVDMSIMATKRFSTEQLANIVMNAGQLGFDDDMLLDRISQNFMTRMSQVDAAELVNLATGLSLADHSPSVILFDAIQKRAIELKSEFSAEQKSALEKAFKSFDYDHKELSSAL